MREYQESTDHSDIGYGHSSDLNPVMVGWVVLIVALLVWAFRTLGSRKASDYDKDGAMVVILIAGVILAFVVAGKLFGWWGVIGLGGAIWYWFSNQKSPPKP